MDYELTPIEAKAAGKTHVLMGTIVDTRDCDIKTYSQDDRWAIKADVEIDDYGLFEDVPVFYHCQFSERAGLGTAGGLITEGSPFVKDDRVVVLNTGGVDDLLAENLKIVAYKDGLPRQCIFQFRITRDDGVVIDKDLLQPLDGISIYQEKPDDPGSYERVGTAHAYTEDEAAYWTHDGDTWYYGRGGPDWAVKFSYNEVTQIWTVPFHVWPDRKYKNNKEFFVFIYCLDSARCMLSSVDNSNPGYVYKTVDFYKDEYAVVSKFYAAKAPYYKTTFTMDRDWPEGPEMAELEALISEEAWPYFYGINPWKRIAVESSISYSVGFISEAPVGWCAFGIGACGVSSKTVAEVTADANARGPVWICSAWFGAGELTPANIAAQIMVTTSSGAEGNPPVSESITITPPSYSVNSQMHSISASYTGSMNVLCQCSDGIASFPVDISVLNFGIGISAAPNI